MQLPVPSVGWVPDLETARSAPMHVDNVNPRCNAFLLHPMQAPRRSLQQITPDAFLDGLRDLITGTYG